MPIAVCQFHEYDPPRCRKRATVAIGYRALAGHRVCMTGPDIPCYITSVTLRCPRHASQEIPGEVLGTLPIAEYWAKLAERK